MPPARDVDDRDRGHPDDRALEHPVTDRLSRVFAADDPERRAKILASGVAGRGLLGERLHGRLDGDIDGKTDVDRRAANVDLVRTVPIFGRRQSRRRCCVGVQPIERTRRALQRRERLQHHGERGRDAPALVVRAHVGARLVGASDGARGRTIGRGNAEHRGLLAQLRGDAARAGDEILRHRGFGIRVGEAHVDAPGQAAPRIGARDLLRRDFDVLLRTPMLQRAVDDRAAPRERGEHPSFASRDGGDRGSDVRALHDKPAAGIVWSLDRSLERRTHGVEPAPRVETHRVGDAPVGPGAEAEQRRVEFLQLRGHPLCGRERRLVRSREKLPDPLHPAAAPIPFGAALGNAFEQRLGCRQRDRPRVAAHDGALERLECRDFAQAYVLIAAASRLGGRIGRPDFATATSTSSSSGTTAMLAAIANSRSVAGRFSRMGGRPRNVDVQAEREERHVDEQRRHAEAHERKRDAGQRKHGEIAGDGHRQLAKCQHHPRNREPAQECLVVVDDAALHLRRAAARRASRGRGA
jgi:hypothetical protein